MTLAPQLVALLAAELVLVALLAAGFARALGLRLARGAALTAILLPWLLLAPRWIGDEVALPTGPLEQIPGAPASGRGAWEVLNDVVYQFLPWELEVRRAFAGGRLPLWSDVIDGGGSPWINPQAQVLSPIAWLARAFPIEHALLAALALKMAIAWNGTWIAAAAIGARPRGRWIAATAFAAGGGIVAWGLFPHSAAAAFAPWSVAAAIRIARRPRPRRIAVGSIVTAALLVSGHPEVAAFALALAVGAAIAFARRRPASLADPALALSLALALGALLAAPLWIPFALALPSTERWRQTSPDASASARLSATEAALGSGPGSARRGALALAPLSPEAFGQAYREPFRGPLSWPDAMSGYAGLAALAGALLALRRPTARRALPWLLAAALLVGFAAGIRPLVALAAWIPGLERLARARGLPIASLALALAAALGWSRLLAPRRAAAPAQAPLSPDAATILLAAGASLALAPRLLPAIAWLALLAATLSARRPRVALAGIAIAFVAAELPWVWRQLPAGDRAQLYPATPFMSELAARSERSGGGRVAGLEFEIYPAIGAAYGLADIRPHNPLASAGYARLLAGAFDFSTDAERYIGRLGRLPLAPASRLGLRFLVVRPPAVAPAGFAALPLADRAGVELWENAAALPPVFAPSRVDAVDPRHVSAWFAALDDPRAVSVEPGVDRPAISGTAEVSGNSRAAGAIRIRTEAPGRIDLELAAPVPPLLATTLLWPAGWRIEGPSNVRRVVLDGAFLGLALPAETRALGLRFVPPGLAAGAWAALVGGVGTLGLGFGFGRRPRGRT